jgi:hypothetical protein
LPTCIIHGQRRQNTCWLPDQMRRWCPQYRRCKWRNRDAANSGQNERSAFVCAMKALKARLTCSWYPPGALARGANDQENACSRQSGHFYFQH